MSKTSFSGLTGFSEAMPAPTPELDRDRWPEFEKELAARKVRKVKFDVFGSVGQLWGWMIGRCRRWEEVEQVLNRYGQDYHWRVRREVLTVGEMEIYRIR